MNNSGKRVYAIINPISGVGSKRKIPKMIEDICKLENCDLKILFTEHIGHASELTQQALDAAADIIIAVGGDGTVNEIARAMMHSSALLGIIPKGSGNGLARELHIPMDTKRALDNIFSGVVTTIDGCKANDKIFFCTCGVGFDAAVSQKFASEKRRGSLTYIKNMVEEYLSYKPESYELLVDGTTIKEKAFLIAVANASQYGNNAFIAPHANIQDGMMDITILAPFDFRYIAPLSIQLFTKQIDRNSKIKIIRGKSATIIRQKPGMMHLDGEPVMASCEVQINVIPSVLNIITPATISFTQEVQNLFSEVTRFFDKRIPSILR